MFRCGKTRRQLGELVIDEDAQRLEGARRRMDGVSTRRHHARGDFGENARGLNRGELARGGDGAGDRTRAALLAQGRDNRGKLALRCRGNHLCRGRSAAAHAHVERTVVTEGKPPLRLVELHRGNAEIEHHAIDRLAGRASPDGAEIREFVLDEREPRGRASHKLGAACDRGGIAIDRDNAAIRGSEERAAVAAGAERGIDIDAAIAYAEELDRWAGEHGNVTSQSASDSTSAVAARRHSRAPPSAAIREPSCFLSARTFSVASASSARKRPGSQI